LGKRLIKSPKLNFCDNGLVSSLLNINSLKALEGSPHLGNIWKNFVFTELIKEGFITGKNLFYALRVTGTCNSVKTRSVPAQTKPYLPLMQVTTGQPEFETDTVTGILSGFYCPPFVKSVNVPGYQAF
jgi:hypothetical protein